jgi:hypothetical protein
MSRGISRRRLLELLAGSAAAASWPACGPRAAPRERLAALLGLRPAEQAWLDELRPREQERLLAGLQGKGPLEGRALDAAIKLLSRRSHLFPYLGYPEVADERSVCDGLVRE